VAGRRAVRDAVLERIGDLGCAGRLEIDGLRGIGVGRPVWKKGVQYGRCRLRGEYCGGHVLRSDEGTAAGRPVAGVEAMPSHAGGCAANVAIDLAKQGIAVDVAGCLGKDSSAVVIVKEITEAGVGQSGLVYTAELQQQDGS